MKEIFQVMAAAGAGVFIAEMIEPKLVSAIKPTADWQVKGIKAGAAAGSAGLAYWLIKKVA